MAPEMYEQEPVGKEVDIWSLGVMLYFMTHKEIPFQGKNKL